MEIVNAEKARDNLCQLISDVNSNGGPITIANSCGEKAILLSENDWNAMQEIIYLNSIPEMPEFIIEGVNTSIEDCLTENEVNW